MCGVFQRGWKLNQLTDGRLRRGVSSVVMKMKVKTMIRKLKFQVLMSLKMFKLRIVMQKRKKKMWRAIKLLIQ